MKPAVNPDMRKAPTGAAILGVYENVGTIVPVHFDPYTPQGYVEADLEPLPIPDRTETATINGNPMFVDANDEHWLYHHLIPDHEEPLDDAAIRAFQHELLLGAVMEASSQLISRMMELAEGFGGVTRLKEQGARNTTFFTRYDEACAKSKRLNPHWLAA